MYVAVVVRVWGTSRPSPGYPPPGYPRVTPMYYNFCRVRKTLRVTPAMQAGLSNHIWEIEELVALMEPKSILDGLMRPA